MLNKIQKYIESSNNPTYGYYVTLSSEIRDLPDSQKDQIYSYMLKKALEAEEKDNRLIAQLHIEKKQYREAIEYLNQNKPDSTNYAMIGTCHKELEDYRKALEYYDLAIKIDYSEIWPYLDAAECAENLDEYQLAENYYTDAIDLLHGDEDIEPEFFLHYDYSQFLFRRDRIQEAITQIDNAISISQKADVTYEIAIQQKTFLQAISSSNAKKNILISALKIREALICEAESISHYTSIDTLLKLSCEKSEFWISEASYMNDPKEGDGLIRLIPLLERGLNEYTSESIAFTSKPFIMSLVESNNDNELTLWRLYGKTNGIEASGASITFKREALLSAIIDSVKFTEIDESSENAKKAKNNALGHNTAYKVAYVSRDLNISNSNLSIEIKQIIHENINTINDNIKIGRFKQEEIGEMLSDISFLFKDAEYQAEKEIRIIINQNLIKPKFFDKQSPPRVYLGISNILATIQKVTIGPRAEKSNSIEAVCYYKYKELGLDIHVAKSTHKFR